MKTTIIFLAAAGVVLLTAAVSDFSPAGTLDRTRAAAETSAFAWAGYSYSGPFAGRTDEIASRVRTMEALESLAAVTPESIFSSTTFDTLTATNFTFAADRWDDTQSPAAQWSVGGPRFHGIPITADMFCRKVISVMVMSSLVIISKPGQ